MINTKEAPTMYFKHNKKGSSVNLLETKPSMKTKKELDLEVKYLEQDNRLLRNIISKLLQDFVALGKEPRGKTKDRILVFTKDFKAKNITCSTLIGVGIQMEVENNLTMKL